MMESILPLGYRLEKSPTTLHLTADPKERRAAAVFSAVVGLAGLLVIVFVPFSRIGWAGLIVLGSFGTACLLVAFLIGLCRTEIEFDLAGSRIVHRRLVLGRIWSTSALPLDHLKAIKVMKKGRGAGELQLVQADGTVWAKWVFLVEPLAEDIRKEILEWLRKHSAHCVAEEWA